MLPGRIKETRAYQRVRAFTERYERFFMPGMLAAGTAIDAIQFRLLEIQTTFIISGIYAFICAAAMVVIAAPAREGQFFLRYAKLAAPFLQQFTIGALLSTSLLFYWFSGSISASWPIIGAAVLLMVFNEVFRHFFVRPSVQAGVYFFALFSIAAALSAYVFNSLHPLVFIIGGLASLCAMAVFLTVYLRVGKLYGTRERLWASVVVIFALMNTAYFFNLIPPIPLSLRDAGMYSNVTRSGGEYILEGEEESWLQKLIPGQTIHTTAGQPLYAFTAISAPAALSTTMVHRWQYFDDVEHKWVTSDALSFGITGGRSDGYRGYSRKSQLTAGKWRVSVETSRGQVLGRIHFRVVFE